VVKVNWKQHKKRERWKKSFWWSKVAANDISSVFTPPNKNYVFLPGGIVSAWKYINGSWFFLVQYTKNIPNELAKNTKGPKRIQNGKNEYQMSAKYV
jgi:hypothetical protein